MEGTPLNARTLVSDGKSSSNEASTFSLAPVSESWPETKQRGRSRVLWLFRFLVSRVLNGAALERLSGDLLKHGFRINQSRASFHFLIDFFFHLDN